MRWGGVKGVVVVGAVLAGSVFLAGGAMAQSPDISFPPCTSAYPFELEGCTLNMPPPPYPGGEYPSTLQALIMRGRVECSRIPLNICDDTVVSGGLTCSYFKVCLRSSPPLSSRRRSFLQSISRSLMTAPAKQAQPPVLMPTMPCPSPQLIQPSNPMLPIPPMNISQPLPSSSRQSDYYRNFLQGMSL